MKLVRDGRDGCGAGGQEAVQELRHGAGEAEHVEALEVHREDMLGRPHHNLGLGDGVDVLELGHLGEHGGDLAEVTHVDAAVVDRVGESGAVHRGRAVVEAVSDEAGDLDRDEKVCRVLIQLALLLQVLAFRLEVVDAGGKYVGVESYVELGVLETAHNGGGFFNDFVESSTSFLSPLVIESVMDSTIFLASSSFISLSFSVSFFSSSFLSATVAIVGSSALI